ncbi:MAG: hypothetical protein ABSA41_16955 [Terriglobia bacterium]
MAESTAGVPRKVASLAKVPAGARTPVGQPTLALQINFLTVLNGFGKAGCG